jgi:hypothetical protein
VLFGCLMHRATFAMTHTDDAPRVMLQARSVSAAVIAENEPEDAGFSWTERNE